LVLKYFKQLTKGCGNKTCTNPDCFTATGKKLTKKEALRRALVLASKKNKPNLCIESQNGSGSGSTSSSKGKGIGNGGSGKSKKEKQLAQQADDLTQKKQAAAAAKKKKVVAPVPVIPPISLESFKDLVTEAEARVNNDDDAEPDYKCAIRVIGQVFSVQPNDLALCKSFLRTKDLQATDIDAGLDFKSVTEFYSLVEKIPPLQEALNGAVDRLCQSLTFFSKSGARKLNEATLFRLRKFLILLENPAFLDPESHQTLKNLCEVISKLPAKWQDVLVKWFSNYSPRRFEELIGRIQQYITVRWYTTRHVDDLQYGTIVLGLLYRANEPWRNHKVHEYTETKEPPTSSLRTMLARHASSRHQQQHDAKQARDSKSNSNTTTNNNNTSNTTSTTPTIAATSTATGTQNPNLPAIPNTNGGLDVKHQAASASASGSASATSSTTPIRVVISHTSRERHKPLVDPEMFNNDAVNSELSLKSDYKRWIEHHNFSFCKYHWILDASSKRDILHLDARYEMSDHFREAMIQRLYVGAMSSPYLTVEVRRSNLIRDTIVQLQNAKLENMILREEENGSDDSKNTYFKKPLKIRFAGEEGVDEGGVKKEFFQLVVAQIFDPKYGMFTYDSVSRTCWFNRDSVSSDEEYELVGIILGLAIYNMVILELRFPMYVYKKLMGYDSTLEDLKEVDPEMCKGFRKLLAFTGDVENTYCRNFAVTYESFGVEKTVELKEGGKDIPLTDKNREEYVELYTKYMLHDSILRQFDAFKKGFMKVCGGPALQLFRPEELHMLICGSEELDFDALEKKTHYDGGYTKDSPVIKNLWKILKRFSLEQKKKFLMFCTGSDRAPINGLGHLGFTISRNGPDSERLPTSHTCFNHLLLPQYDTEEKLEKNLLIAVQNCKGFGLL